MSARGQVMYILAPNYRTVKFKSSSVRQYSDHTTVIRYVRLEAVVGCICFLYHECSSELSCVYKIHIEKTESAFLHCN